MLALAAASIALAPHSVRAQASARADILTSLPTGAFFENLEPQADGSVLFTSYFSRQILRWSPSGVSVFAELGAHPVDLISIDGGFLVTAHGAPFTSGPSFTGTMAVLRLDSTGRTVGRVEAPQALFLNGIARLEGDLMLIADSLAGTIWAYGIAGGTLTPWNRADQLKPVASPGEFALGANGLQISGDFVYVSNSSTKTLMRGRLSAGRTVEAFETLGTFTGIDDFAVAENGRIFIATHGTTVILREPDGRVAVVIDRDAEGATSVAFGRGPSAGSLFITTTGGLFAGLKANANLLRVALPTG